MGLESLEARIVVHEKNEVVYEEDIAFLEYDVQVKDISIKEIKNQLENALKEKDKTGLGYDGQINETDLNDIHVNEGEVLNNVFDSRESDRDDNQVNDRFKKGEGYHVVPHPYTGNYMPPRADLSFVGLDNFFFKSKESDSEDENVFKPKEVKKTVKPSLEKINLLMLGIQLAAAIVSAAKRVNTAASRPNMNNALPTTYSYLKAHLPVRRPFNQKSAAKTNNFNEKVNTAKFNNVTTAGPKVVVSVVEGNMNNVVKSLACWIWRPKGNLIDHISKDYGSYTLKIFNYVDPQGRLKSDQGIFDSGCSRHMTGKKSYLIDYQEIDGGFVALGGNAKGVYTSCIEQFWANVKVKNINGEALIQALVDKKKVIITEALIRRDLRFEDEGGFDCLSNEVIFEQQTLIRHNEIFVISFHTKKVFANIKRDGKDFSRKVTPLFETRMKKQKSRRKQRKEIKVPLPTSEIPNEEWLPSTSNDPLPSGEDKIQLNELMILCTNLQKQVLDLEEAKTVQAKEIASLKKREDASKQERMIANIDQDVKITLVDDTQGRMKDEYMFRVNDLDGDEVSTGDPVNTAGEVVITAGIEVTTAATTPQISKDELTLAQTLIENKEAKPTAITTTATIVTAVGARLKEKGIVMKEPSKTPLPKAIISSQKPSQAKEKAMEKCEKVVEGSEKAKEGSSKKEGSNLEQEDAKKQRLEEENESVKLKRCLKIIFEDDDDVTIKAKPLSFNSPTIVYYKIYKEWRKSYFKIIIADGNSQSYLTFRKMFKNFNREDLEVLWSIVKARFKKTKPIDDINNLLFQTLKTMFEHHV
uniref:Retrovirus-related Pol polyprotein from transposon TNT 1-94-like beta-barrel domain-containing protein n=1 Tax=Tanacetum cinerariifolium TaxID=118510 RepID=A0A6L2J2W1_TANCI|nr:hypothetical protein [Tanacetum cinerariifolium]